MPSLLEFVVYFDQTLESLCQLPADRENSLKVMNERFSMSDGSDVNKELATIAGHDEKNVGWQAAVGIVVWFAGRCIW